MGFEQYLEWWHIEQFGVGYQYTGELSIKGHPTIWVVPWRRRRQDWVGITRGVLHIRRLPWTTILEYEEKRCGRSIDSECALHRCFACAAANLEQRWAPARTIILKRHSTFLCFTPTSSWSEYYNFHPDSADIRHVLFCCCSKSRQRAATFQCVYKI